MPKRCKPIPDVMDREDTVLTVARLNPGREQAPSTTTEAGPDQALENPVRKTAAQSLTHKSQRKHSQRQNGQASNGRTLNGAHENGHDQDSEIANRRYQGCNSEDQLRTFIRNHDLDRANRVVMTLLEHRIAAGDSELHAATMLLQHYHVILSRQPPLSHIGTLPLRPNDCLYACFDQFINLIRQQQGQVSELQAIIAELI